jgi:hypothetical protein
MADAAKAATTPTATGTASAMRLKNHGCEELNQEHARDIATVWCTTARHSVMLHRSVTSTISLSFQLG